MTVRLPTISQFKTQLNHMSQQYHHVSKLQNQVASGKKIEQSSDDPTLASRIKSVQDYIDRLDAYSINTTLADNRLTLLDTTLQEQVDLTIKAKELILRSQNGTLNDNDRAGIAAQLSGILGQMVNLANTQDGNGEYIFNGFNANTPPFVKNGNTYVYQGSYEGNFIKISDQKQVQYSDSGFALFGDIKSGNGAFSVAADANNAGTGVLQSAKITDSNSITEDNYTLTVVTNSSGQLAYEIIGLSSGQVIPAPPLAAPMDAPAYVPGSTIHFNGISVQLNGTPEVGDKFTINQSHSQNIFQTIQNAIDALKTPITTPKTQADMEQILVEQATSLTGSLEHLVTQLASIGERRKIVEDQIKLNQDMSISQQAILSSLADVDMVKAISDLTQQLTALDMSQQSYMKMQEIFTQLLREQFR